MADHVFMSKVDRNLGGYLLNWNLFSELIFVIWSNDWLSNSLMNDGYQIHLRRTLTSVIL